MTSESTEGPSSTLRHPYWLAGLVTAALGAWLTAPVWGPSPPAGDDVAAHIIRADFAFSHIFGPGHLDGWLPRFMVGYQAFLFYGPGFTWLVGLIRLATFGLLSTAGAVKVAGALGLAGIAPATMFMARGLFIARGLRLNPSASIAAGLLAVAVNSPFGVGLHSIYVIGLLPHQMAAVLFCVAIGAAVRTLHDARRRWVVATGASLALLAVTHIVSAGIAAIFATLILGAQLGACGGVAGWWKRLAAAGALSLGLSAFWTLPFVAHRDLRGPVTAWQTPPVLERIGEIVSGEVAYPAGLALLVAAALLATLAFADRAPALLALVPVAYLAGAHAMFAAAPANAVAIQLPNRGLGYAALVALVPAAQVLQRLTERATERVTERSISSVTVIVLAGIAAVVFSLPARGVAAERAAPSTALVGVAGVLRREVPDGMRFATERDFPGEIARSGFAHPDLWLAEMSGRDTLNLFNAESSYSRAGFASEAIGRRSARVLAPALVRAAVSHVVTVRDDTSRELAASPGYRLLWSADDFAVFAVNRTDQVGPFHAAGLGGHLRAAAPEHIVADVDVPGARTATAAVSWSPKWEVRVDGVAVATRPGADGLVSFDLPGGDRRVELQFSRDRWDAAGIGLTVATLAGLLAYCLLSSRSSLMSRRRSRTA
jgi:hypothetical protein